MCRGLQSSLVLRLNTFCARPQEKLQAVEHRSSLEKKAKTFPIVYVCAAIQRLLLLPMLHDRAALRITCVGILSNF